MNRYRARVKHYGVSGLVGSELERPRSAPARLPGREYDERRPPLEGTTAVRLVLW
jgi:hypothetical protein